MLNPRYVFFFVACFLQCTTSRHQIGRSSSTLFLSIHQSPEPLVACTPLSPTAHTLVLFVSQHCHPCHRMMKTMYQHQTWLKQNGISTLLAWTDARHCLQAHRLSANCPQWAFAQASEFVQQEWGIQATPTLYLLFKGKPILKIRGNMPFSKVQHALQKSLSLFRDRLPTQ